MDSAELVDWMAFYEHERRHAETLAMMINCTPRKTGRVVNWTEIYTNPWGEQMLDRQGWTPEQIAFLEKRKKAKARKGKK